jgi:hypothetical protein
MQRSCGIAQGFGALAECFIGIASVGDTDANAMIPAKTILVTDLVRIDL